MKCLRVCALAVTVATMVAGKEAAAQLVNPGFETDAVLNAAPNPTVTGWTLSGNATTTSANTHPVHSGIGSLRLVGNGNFGVPVAFQTLPASPGQIWDFQGFMLTPATLPPDATFGLLKIVWSNGTSDLAPGPIIIGQPGPVANPGVEALPFVNSTSTPNTWIFTQARGIAPVGTTQVSFFSIFVDQSPGTAYFDDLRATQIPEPMTLGLIGGVLLSLVGVRRKRRR